MMQSREKIFLLFLRDRILFTIAYFLSILLIIIFYYLSVREKIEVLYPFIMGLFIYLVFMFIDGVRFYRFHKALILLVENQYAVSNAVTQEQKIFVERMDKVHNMYLNQIDVLKREENMKESLITQWIHNMKTPISVISLILQRAEYKKTDDKLALEKINEENDKLIEQMENLLTIIRLDHFTEDYMLEPVNLFEEINKIINKKKNQFVYNRVFPKVLIEEKDIWVMTDPKWNGLMLEQIISNAIKYSYRDSNQSKYIYFSILREEKRVKLNIRDEGIGISEYDLKRIFDPFVTGDNGRLIDNSTGIGLFICRTIAKQLGHHIDVESKIGQGSIFSIDYLSKL